MEIEYRGRHPNDDVFKGHCHHCKSRMKATRGELSVESDREGEEFGRAKCPVCEHSFILYPATSE